MATKPAIVVPKKLFDRTTRFARENKTSRSAIVARALDSYLQARDRDRMIDDLNRIADLKEDRDLAAFVREAGRRSLARVEWQE